MTNQHGGARPKVREDDGRKNNRPVVRPGRKPQRMTMKLGDKFFVGILNGGIWTVEEITRTSITFADEYGEKYKLIR